MGWQVEELKQHSDSLLRTNEPLPVSHPASHTFPGREETKQKAEMLLRHLGLFCLSLREKRLEVEPSACWLLPLRCSTPVGRVGELPLHIPPLGGTRAL